MAQSGPAPDWGDDEELIQLLGVVLEHVVQTLDDSCERHVGSKSQVDNAGVRLAMAKDEFAKVTIVGNEDAVLLLGETEHVNVREAGRVLAANADRIVTQALEIGDETRV